MPQMRGKIALPQMTPGTQMLAGTDGILFSRRPDGQLAWPGKVAYRVAGAAELAHRKGMSGLDD